MGKGLGAASLGGGFGLQPITRGLRSKAKGLYPTKTTGAGEYGTILFPTVLENYNRTTDYKRWQLGQAYYYGVGRSWDDVYLYSNTRFSTGAVSGVSKDIVAMFPSKTSPERTWYVGCRTRGSIILPQPLNAAALTAFTSDPDPANHRLVYDVSGVLTATQVGIFNVFIGDQFEDTAIGPNYPDDVIEKPEGSIALTLLEANAGALTLTFDLSKAFTRARRNNTLYWKKIDYDPASPPIWDTSGGDGGKHLCSSHKLFCCCPDHLGGALANLEFPKESAGMDSFPLPNASRTVFSQWEKEGAGYYRQWRSLPQRIDERRECKHMHAMRWECGIPWYEPNDYPFTGNTEDEFSTFTNRIERDFGDEVYSEYNARHRINYDRYILSLAEVVGINLFPGGDVREGIRPSSLPMLWNDPTEPEISWCRQNDWWLKRGTQQMRIFNSATQKFESIVTQGGIEFPMIESVKGGSANAPVIIK